MKFRFNLEALIKQRKIEQDLAQRDYATASENLRLQLNLIKRMYAEIDQANIEIEGLQSVGGIHLVQIQQLHDFKNGQQIKIQRARERARELMRIEEEKHELLIEKMKLLKIIEKLKEKKLEEFKQIKKKRLNKQIDDITTTRYQPKR